MPCQVMRVSSCPWLRIGPDCAIVGSEVSLIRDSDNSAGRVSTADRLLNATLLLNHGPGLAAHLERAPSLHVMVLAADADPHRVAISDCHPHVIARNPHLDRPPAPTHREGHAAPFRRQPRSKGDRVAAQLQTGEAEYYRLPHTPQSGDPYAAGTVRVEFKVGGRSLCARKRRSVRSR
jgi:hypothetical protein